jgi:thiamine pyrophosphate-dependent acetolactate synthase large subunit-like protein
MALLIDDVPRQLGRPSLWNPDFVKMTEAMGGRGIRIEHPDQFGDAYREAIRSNIPTVIEVVITATPAYRSPAPQRFRGI